jgi:hypothetical protein
VLSASFFAIFDAPTATVNWSGLTVEFSINRRDLGGTSGFDFWIRSHQNPPDSDLIDDAPNDGTWTYELTAGARAARVLLPATLKPRAGKVLDARAVRVQLSDGTRVAAARLTCRADERRHRAQATPGRLPLADPRASEGQTNRSDRRRHIRRHATEGDEALRRTQIARQSRAVTRRSSQSRDSGRDALDGLRPRRTFEGGPRRFGAPCSLPNSGRDMDRAGLSSGCPLSRG